MKLLSAVCLFLRVLAVSLPVCGAASAHTTSLGGIAIEVKDNDVAVVLTLSAHDLATAVQLPTGYEPDVQRSIYEKGADLIGSYIAERLAVGDGTTPCRLRQQDIEVDRSDPPESIVATAVFHCPLPIRYLTVDYGLFFDIDDQHRVLGTLTADGHKTDILLDAGTPRFQAVLGSSEADLLQRFLQIFQLGVEHILTGYDHLLFLAALLIGIRHAGRMVAVVTAFTVAHSLTLGLAWYGIVKPPGQLVEILIAVSIAIVAVGNLTGRGRQHGWLLAGGFGLIHGLGFYGALKELGLDREHAVTTLLGFNLGVEAGQLAVVAIAWLPLSWWARQSWHPRTAFAASAAILMVAGWWVIERSIA